MDEVEFAKFKQIYKMHLERKAMMLLDNFCVGDKVTFNARGSVIVARIQKVAIKNLKAVEVEVDGQTPTFARKWTVAPSFCTKVQ